MDIDQVGLLCLYAYLRGRGNNCSHAEGGYWRQLADKYTGVAQFASPLHAKLGFLFSGPCAINRPDKFSTFIEVRKMNHSSRATRSAAERQAELPSVSQHYAEGGKRPAVTQRVCDDCRMFRNRGCTTVYDGPDVAM